MTSPSARTLGPPPATARPCPRFPRIAVSIFASVASVVTLDAQTASRRAAREPVPVMWLLGQSNANGALAGFWLANPLADGKEFNALASQERVKIWWPGKSAQRPDSKPGWESYRTGSIEPVNNATYHLTEGAFGPECSIGAAAAEHFGATVHVFKYSVVSALRTDFKASWTKTKDGVGLYGDVMREWRRAAEALIAEGKEPQIHGVFFSQGESDRDQADGYHARLVRFLADLRADLAEFAPKPTGSRSRRALPIPVVLGQLHARHEPRAEWEKGEELIRKAQAKIAADDPHTALCPTDDLPLMAPGDIHFDGPGSIRYGYEMFAQLRTMLAERAEKPRGAKR